MIIPIIIICFIIILLIISLIAYNLNYYKRLLKDTWLESPILMTIMLALSLTLLTFGVFTDFKNNNIGIPIYFMILFFEIVWLLSIYHRNYSPAILISCITFILTGFEMILLAKSKNPEICWLVSPFLFFSLIEIGITDNIYKYNIDHEDIVNHYKNIIN